MGTFYCREEELQKLEYNFYIFPKADLRRICWRQGKGERPCCSHWMISINLKIETAGKRPIQNCQIGSLFSCDIFGLKKQGKTEISGNRSEILPG